MKRSFLESLVLEKSLAVVNGHDCGDLLESTPANPVLRNVCAKVTTKLADDIADVCAALDIRQRRFVEAALLDAVRRANAIIDEEGVHEALTEWAGLGSREEGAIYDGISGEGFGPPRVETVTFDSKEG